MNQKTYYDITKEYPDMYRVMIYKTPYTPTKIKKQTLTKIFSNIDLQKSLLRTKRTIKDYVMCNDFDWFLTFTFDPKKVDRYDMLSTYLKMQTWLWKQHKKNKEFKYLIVPERHKDGAIHFHALVQNAPFEFKKSNVIQDSKRVFTIPDYTLGFTNATQLVQAEKSAAVNYISKYITKEMISLPNKRRYWCSKNLRKPQTYYNSIYDLGIASKINHSTIHNDTEFNSVHHIPKDLFD